MVQNKTPPGGFDKIKLLSNFVFLNLFNFISFLFVICSKKLAPDVVVPSGSTHGDFAREARAAAVVLKSHVSLVAKSVERDAAQATYYMMEVFCHSVNLYLLTFRHIFNTAA